MLEEIRRKREEIRNNICKSFGSDLVKGFNDELGVIEKAVYADTAENRKLGRVGQEYHRGKGKKENAAPVLNIKDLMENDTEARHDVTRKYGVKLFSFANGSMQCRIENKKEVKGLKNFLKDCGLSYDEKKLVKMKGFHGTHSYNYDLSSVTGVKSPGME